MARRGRGGSSAARPTMFGSLNALVNGIITIGTALGFGFFLTNVLKQTTMDSYATARNYTHNNTGYYLYDTNGTHDFSTVKTGEVNTIGSPFDTVNSVLLLITGLLSLIALVMLFKGWILPFIGMG